MNPSLYLDFVSYILGCASSAVGAAWSAPQLDIMVAC